MADMVFLTNLKPLPMGVHDISTAYGINSLVMSEDGAAAYLSVKDVPAGTPLTDTQYWKVHTDLSLVKQRAEEATVKALAARDEMMEIARNLTDEVKKESNPVQAIDLVGGLPFGSVETRLEPKQAGSGDASPSNVRQISGWTGAKLTRCGKNLLPYTRPGQTINGITYTPNSDGSISVKGTATGGSSTYDIATKYSLPAGTYKISGSASACGVAIRYTGTDGNYKYVGSNSGYVVTFTLPDAQTDLYVYAQVQGGVTADTVIRPLIRVNEDETNTFEAYQGNAFALDFGQTVYGGTLNWQTGALKVDRAMLTLTGNEVWQKSNGDNNRYYISHTANPALSLWNVYNDGFFDVYFHTCSHYKATVYAASLANNACTIFAGTEATAIAIKDERFSTVDEWKNYVAAQYAAGTPVQIVYRTINKTTIQLTPQEIKQLDGTNTLHGDGSIVIVGLQDPHPAIKARLEALESAILNV